MPTIHAWMSSTILASCNAIAILLDTLADRSYALFGVATRGHGGATFPCIPHGVVFVQLVVAPIRDDVASREVCSRWSISWGMLIP